jgi:hypothetical protein
VFSNDGNRRLSALDVILYPTGRFTDRLISRSDAQGIYSLPGVPLGPYTVKVKDTHSALTGESSGEMRNDGDRNTTDIRLEASGRITGKVYAAGVILNDAGEPFDTEGRAIDDPAVATNASVAIRGPRTSQTVQTDERGEFKSGEFLPLGEYSLTVRPVKGDDGVTRETALTFEGEQAFVPMALAGTGSVSGVVLDSLGEKPVGVARVTLRSRSPFSRREVSRFTETDGSFLFENIPVGDFSLSVITTVGVPELRAAAEGVLTRHGETVAFRDTDDAAKPQAIRLQPAGEIAGRVMHPDEKTLAQGAIVVLRRERLRLGRLTDEDGRFRFDAGVPYGCL